MCSQALQKRIHQSHRWGIAVFSILGFWGDGAQLTDIFFICALVLWLWQVELETWEFAIADFLSARLKVSGVFFRKKLSSNSHSYHKTGQTSRR